MSAGTVRGRAANDGAHRLAWWLGEGRDAERFGVLQAYGVGPSLVDRMLAGTLIPVDGCETAIARATEGEVMPADWDAEPGPHWAHAPIPREGARA